MAEVRRANADIGNHWFDADTLRYFRSRVSDHLYGGRYFVSSERGPGMPRFYSVRRVNDDGSIDTVGSFGQHVNREGAHRFARRCAEIGDEAARLERFGSLERV